MPTGAPEDGRGREGGVDATITPQFKIEANPDADGKKYWQVSYDNGSLWKVM